MILTDLQKKLIKLDNQKELVKKYHEDMAAVCEELHSLHGEGFLFQDPESGSVFKLTKPTGQYVFNRLYSYGRTKRDGEAKGSLSKKEAEEAGFEV